MYIMENITYPQRKRTPSFSSSLLDTIYRSIDESKSNLDNETNNHNTTLKHINLSHNHNHHGDNFVIDKSCSNKESERIMNLRRHSAILDDDWIEKQSTHTSSQFMNSSSITSTSSESSYGGGTLFFSSSETEHTTQNRHKTRPRSSKHEMRHVFEKNHQHQHQHQKNPKHERGTSFERTKLRALKIYGELNQKVRHPISPGSRIASFLSSIFSSGNVKKAKMCYVGAVEDVTFEHKSKSPCLSNSSTTSSSFSRRSCMSKTPKNNNNGVKRSVRFYPVSVILGEDSHQLPSSCHRYSNYEKNDPSLLPLHSSVRKVSRSSNSIEEFKKNCVMAKENIGIGVNTKGCHNNNNNNNNCGKGNGKFGFRGFYDGDDEDDDDDDEDGDALSYSSSDLFELDHIIGAARYQEELPVYETTNLETNMAIANGLCL